MPPETTFTCSTSSPCRAAIAGTPPAAEEGPRPVEVPGEHLGADREGAPQPSLRWPQRADVEVGDEQPPVRREHTQGLADNAHLAA